MRERWQYFVIKFHLIEFYCNSIKIHFKLQIYTFFHKKIKKNARRQRKLEVFVQRLYSLQLYNWLFISEKMLSFAFPGMVIYIYEINISERGCYCKGRCKQVVDKKKIKDIFLPKRLHFNKGNNVIGKCRGNCTTKKRSIKWTFEDAHVFHSWQQLLFLC